MKDKKIKKLDIITKAAHIINSSLAFEDVRQQLIDLMRETMNYDEFHFLTMHAGELSFIVGKGVPDEKLQMKLKIGEGITGCAAQERKTIFSPDVSKDKRYIKLHNQAGAEIAVPIVDGDQVIGVLNAESYEENGLSTEDVRLLEALAEQYAIAWRKSQLIEHLEQKNKKLEIVSEVSSLINSALDVKKILQLIARVVTDKLGYDNFSILFLEGDKLVLKAGIGHPEIESPGYHISIHSGITGYVTRSGKPEIVNDLSKDVRYVAIRDDVQSEMVIPLIIDGNVFGVFNVESVKKNAFNLDDLFLIQSLAEQTSVAIENAHFTRSLRRSNKRMKAITEIGNIINSELKLDVVLQKFLEYAGKDLNFDFCAVLLIEGNRLYARAGIGFTPKEISEYSAEIGVGICGEVAKSGQPILCNDVTKHHTYIKQSPRTKAEMAVPLIVGGRTIGVLNIEGAEKDIFTDEDLEYCELLADQAAIAIRNAQQYDKIQNFNTELKREVKSATRHLSKANKELEKLNNVKSEFVSTVSHELRTPLTSIHGYVALMSDEEVGSINEDQKEFLGIVKSESLRLTRLINDLLDVSKIESGKYRLQLDAFDLNEFLSRYVREAKELARAKSIVIDISVPKKLSVIQADADKIKQVFHNLVSNAIKFSPEKTTVSIVVEENKTHVVVHVKDQGMGISAEDLEHIFDKFHRVDNSMTRQTGGTGLGLPITKYLVEAHGGTISVSSEKGKGSEFVFSLKKS